MALDAYHRELAKLNSQCGNNLLALQHQAISQQHLQGQGHHNGMAQDLSLPKERKETKLPNGELESGPGRLHHSRSGFPVERPKPESGVCHIDCAQI